MNLPKPKREKKARKPIGRLPRCKNCGNKASDHIKPENWQFGGEPCIYAPARGKRQKAKTPEKLLREKCDALWSRLVKVRGHCEITRPHECKNGLQAMHGISRRYAATRHLPINGFPGCGAIHMYFTKRPEEWSAYLVEAWGVETFRELWRSAQSMQPVNLAATYAALKSELERTLGGATSCEDGV